MKIEELLSQKFLVVSHSPTKEIIGRIIKSQESSKEVSILYGETFDDNGHPIDSLKYYFFVSILCKILKSHYLTNVNAIILIADLGVYRNYPDEIEKYKIFADERKKFCEKVKRIYNCSYDVVLMSDFVSTKDFEEKLKKIREISFSNPEILEMIEKTVPEDKLEIERKRGYIYSLEEIATIIDFDMKIGPPREKLYDETANKILKYFGTEPLLSIYLYPTYPLGLPYSAYLSSPQIKTFGLTPYKVGSKGFTKNRIILGKTSLNEVKDLIDKTQISNSPNKPNPILDLAIIAELARQHLEGKFEKINICQDFYSGKIDTRKLKEITYEKLEEYILKYF